MPNSRLKSTLPSYDGGSAFDGALRFFCPTDRHWIENWSSQYGSALPALKFFAGDAFGVLYGLDGAGRVTIFWTETGQTESLGVSEGEFYGLIAQDPDGTINLSLYKEAVGKLGRPERNQDFAFKIETALGGKLEVDNLYIVERDQHLATLGKVARQIRDIKVGTKLRPA